MTDESDDVIVIDPERPLRLSPDAMRSLTKATGRSMTDLLNDEEDEANRIQVLAFATLHRRYTRLGHLPDAATLWEEAGQAEVEFDVAATMTADPLGSASSTTSPPSAGTGA